MTGFRPIANNNFAKYSATGVLPFPHGNIADDDHVTAERLGIEQAFLISPDANFDDK
ncbi:MAG: hypothetical protein LBQ03_02010 [Puniceicoccales bacterium]|jgi:hypothetical protein|nr:hypothetical protein [Puniceicoccales bacterium]